MARIYIAAEGVADVCAPLSPFTRSFSSLLGLKNGIFFAGTSTRSPVLGFRPTRGFRWRVRKLPKPRISILSPARSERTTLSKIVSTTTSLSLRVNSTKRDTSSIKSAFVMVCLPTCYRLFGPESNAAAHAWRGEFIPITFSNFRACWQVPDLRAARLFPQVVKPDLLVHQLFLRW